MRTLKMKKAITLALVLVLTLLCGLQIVADDIDTTRAACTHVDTTFFSILTSNYTNGTELYHNKFIRVQYHCTNCGKVWEETNSSIESHHFVDDPDDPDYNWCTLCDGVYHK